MISVMYFEDISKKHNQKLYYANKRPLIIFKLIMSY